MNRSQALKKAVARWGKNAAVRDEGRKTSPELRAASLARLKELRAVPEPRPQAVKDEIKQHLGAGLDYRYQVGYVGGDRGVLVLLRAGPRRHLGGGIHQGRAYLRVAQESRVTSPRPHGGGAFSCAFPSGVLQREEPK